MEINLFLLVSLFVLTLFSLSYCRANASSPSLAKPNCQSHCGNIEIPFPFGIGPGCYRDNSTLGVKYDRGFQLLCDTSTKPHKPFLNISDASRPEVLDISLSGTLRIKNPIVFSDCPNKTNQPGVSDLSGTPFYVSEKNKFTSVSCGRIASLLTSTPKSTSTLAVCLSICQSRIPIMANNTCGGINCCQTSIPFGTSMDPNISFGPLINDTGGSETSCKYAFLVDPEWFTSSSTNTSTIVDMDYVPLLLNWGIYREGIDDLVGAKADNSTTNMNCELRTDTCSCVKGYQGNPYIRGGCKDINECEDPRYPNVCGSKSCSNIPGDYVCYSNPQPIKVVIIVLCSVFGIVFVIIGTWWLNKVIKQRLNEKRKQMLYEQNGGLLLEKLLSSGEVNVEKIKLFDEIELENATDRFNVDRVLGEGGQGTVYKGMLADGKIVAVKKSKIVDGGDVSQFINEIVILSQINHRNVVKILGCCLETKVPLLVYEYLPKGTLSQYIQSRDVDFPLTWEARLQVGLEVAGALSYLHFSASMPIYHRDIKSSNILLDEKYRAKVADFGTSRTVSVDKTHLTMTYVNGTFGYLDPEYFQTSQFTDKSDVYSFGVVLAELLTGHKPITITRFEDGSHEGKSLAVYFVASLEENFLFDILDPEVIKKGNNDEIMVVANLIKRCLNVNGKKRPTMKEVVTELEGVLISSRSSGVEQGAYVGYQETELAEAWDAAFTSTGLYTNTSSSLDGQPLMAFKSFS